MSRIEPRPHAPLLDQLGVYPFVQLAKTRAERRASGTPFYDFSVGEPREETPLFLRQALLDAVPARTSYPPTHGTGELRTAIADWAARRFDVTLDPDENVLATSGSKEALYSIHSAVLDRSSARRIVWIPTPAYPVYEVGARMAGAEVRFLPLLPENGFRPDFSPITDAEWERTALLWVNSPNNPSGAILSGAELDEAAGLARRHGFWLASDEAYVDLYFEDPPASALQCGLDNVISFHTTSKRSAMAGFRSGFVAGDREMIRWLARIRPSQGIASPTFVQAAAIAAWGDDAHAADQRRRYATKRDLLRRVLEDKDYELVSTDASFFIYFRTPREETEAQFVARMLASGIGLVGSRAFAPVTDLIEDGPGWIRLALVPTLEECREAAKILEEIL